MMELQSMQSKRGAAESGKSLDPTASGTTAVSVASGACTGGGPEKCSVCAKFRLALRGGAFFHSNEVLDLDYGWFNIVANESEEDYLVDEAIVTDTVEKAQEHATRVRKQLSQYGLLNHYSQIYSGETTRARIVAPFARSELRLGYLLGSGGFSSVYELQDIRLDDKISAGITNVEDAARGYMCKHLFWKPRTPPKNVLDEDLTPRYAVKHLSYKIAKNKERFQRAAIDLVSEGQLLLAMDHPHIIGLRGWSFEGPRAFGSRKYSDYFLILDRLSVTLDQRIQDWRQSFRKLRRRLTLLPFMRRKHDAKLKHLLTERLQVAVDIASAIEFMHSRRLINRDIKTSNIGFDVDNEVKVFDFGLSRLLPDISEAHEYGAYTLSCVGTKVYMAPEVRSRAKYGLPADVYSFAVVLWEIFSLCSPSEDMIRHRMFLEKTKLKEDWLPICPCWPTSIKNVIQNSLSMDPRNRPTIGEVVTILKEELATKELAELPTKSVQRHRRSTFRVDLSSGEYGNGTGEGVTTHPLQTLTDDVGGHE